MFNCAICGIQIFTQNPKRFFCRNCYKQWESDILAKAERVEVCVNHEHHRRRQQVKDRLSVYDCDREFDISNDGKLIPLRTRHEYDD
jgi:protein-arginine kinase activator protein McsA